MALREISLAVLNPHTEDVGGEFAISKWLDDNGSC